MLMSKDFREPHYLFHFKVTFHPNWATFSTIDSDFGGGSGLEKGGSRISDKDLIWGVVTTPLLASSIGYLG